MIGGPAARLDFIKWPRFIEANVVIWRHGGPRARFFHLLGIFTLIFLLSASALMFWGVWNRRFPYEVLFSFVLAATTYGAFHDALSTAVISANVWRRYLDEGRFQPHDQYFREWIRFLEQEGDRGLFPGAMRWALAFWAVYYGIMIFAISFTLVLTPTFHLATPFISAGLDAIFILPCWLAWQFHKRGVSREMESKGYRLSELAKAAGWLPGSR